LICPVAGQLICHTEDTLQMLGQFAGMMLGHFARPMLGHFARPMLGHFARPMLGHSAGQMLGYFSEQVLLGHLDVRIQGNFAGPFAAAGNQQYYSFV
jgi:hypothetical protein